MVQILAPVQSQALGPPAGISEAATHIIHKEEATKEECGWPETCSMKETGRAENQEQLRLSHNMLHWACAKVPLP